MGTDGDLGDFLDQLDKKWAGKGHPGGFFTGYRKKFSPWVNHRLEEEETGRFHDWAEHQGDYYGPAWVCRNCGRKSAGWNLWREDFLPTCSAKKVDK